MNKITNQQGFAVLELLLVAIIVLGLGGIGWYIVSANNKTKKQLDQTAQVNNSVPQTTKKATTQSSNFVFKELGVQITLPSSLKGLAYTARQINLQDGTTATGLDLTSDSYKDFLTSCKAPDMTVTFGVIDKRASTYPANPSPQNDDGALLKQFNGFYIEGQADQQSDPCGNDPTHQIAEPERSSLFNDLTTAFKTATLVQ